MNFGVLMVPSGTTASSCGAVGVPCTADGVGMIASSDLDVLGTAPSSSALYCRNDENIFL